ncbi:MAG: signal recognition particle-docking protein FtsY, partial [Thermoplasmata archaeon]
MFGLLKGLKKTKDRVFSPIENLFKANKLSDEILDEIEELLILSDIGVETSERIIESLRDAGKKRELSFEECRKVVITELERIVEDVPDYKVPDVRPRVIIFVGVNGVGKTSTIGKLANRFAKDGMSVILGCADTFRAAAIEQLELWAKRAKAQVVKQKMGSDPAAVAYDAVQAAIARDVDVAMIDTAG